MRTIQTFAITFVLLVAGGSAFASDSTSQAIKRQAPKGITASFYACVDKASSDTTAQGACLSAEKKVQDTRLNATYKALTGKLTGKAKDDLLTSERAWLEYHDKNSEFETALYGDEPAANLQVTQNEVLRLCDRADMLDKYLKMAGDQ